MKVRDHLARIESFPVTSLSAITGTAPIVILSPHPDDETLGCGGLIAMASQAGRRIAVVVLTDGAGSHPRSLAYPPARLKALRREETRRATLALGLRPEDVTHLDLEDTRAPSGGPVFDRAVDSIAAIVERDAAGSLFVTWKHDPHCDHEAAALIAAAVARRFKNLRLWHYPIWGLHRAADEALAGDLPEGVRLDIGTVRDRKADAIRCYESQMTTLIADDPEGFHFTAETLAPFLVPYERFIEVRP